MKDKNTNKNRNNPKQKSNTSKTPSGKKLMLDVDKLNIDLFGITLINDKPRIVRGALPNETVEAKENYINGIGTVYDTVKVISPSEYREEPPCKYYSECGGCNLLHMQYKRQLKEKTIMVKKYLRNVSVNYIDECVPSNPFACRNKLHLAFAYKNGKTVVGFMDEDTHKVIEIRECLMHGEWYTTLSKALTEWANTYRISPYIPQKESGTLRFAVARKLGDAIMLTLVSHEKEVPFLKELYNRLCEPFKNVSLYLNYNTERSNRVFSDDFTHLYGPEFLQGIILGVKYKLSPSSFFQTNEFITEKIYSRVAEMVKKSNCETVIDLYSGIGITSMLFAKTGKNVISIEYVKDAVKDAEFLAKENKLKDKIKLYCGDCKEILPKINFDKNTFCFVDPPRRGLGNDVCSSIAKASPKTLVYLSCNPESLACDLAVFLRKGYVISSITPYDMFPNTRHVETLVVLDKKTKAIFHK